MKCMFHSRWILVTYGSIYNNGRMDLYIYIYIDIDILYVGDKAETLFEEQLSREVQQLLSSLFL